MADKKRVRFISRCGVGGVYFAAGVEAEIAEPQASYFVKTGQAEFVAEPDAKDAEPKAPTETDEQPKRGRGRRR